MVFRPTRPSYADFDGSTTCSHRDGSTRAKLFFDDEGFDGQLQRSVGKSDSGTANVGACLYIASLISPGDRDSWYQLWSAFAERLVEQAETALATGHTVSARSCYLRACEYFRQAFFWHREDLGGTELQTAYCASVAAFHKVLPLLDHPAAVLEGETPGYIFTPKGHWAFSDDPSYRRLRQHRRGELRLAPNSQQGNRGIFRKFLNGGAVAITWEGPPHSCLRLRFRYASRQLRRTRGHTGRHGPRLVVSVCRLHLCRDPRPDQRCVLVRG